MEEELVSIVQGALFHDIGKLVQRADSDPTAKKHTQWGYDWLKAHGVNEGIAVAALAHHYTKDDDYAFTSNKGLIWYEADNLASSERKGKERLEEGKWHAEVALASPFSRIRNPNNVSESAPLTYLPLLTEPGSIPTARLSEPPVNAAEYRKLLKRFTEDFLAPEVPKPHSVEFLLMLFEKHLSSVPSMTLRIYDGLTREEVKGKHPDLSLYDHAKLTAAIASCIYHYCREVYADEWTKNVLLKDQILDPLRQSQRYLLIGGDLSGVQKFIYTITSKGALRSLKGRSFFLELLTEHIVTELLEQLGLTRCNLIFSGGGHFYILAQNTAHAQSVLASERDYFQEYLFAEFKGGLGLHLEAVSFGPEGFYNATSIWTSLSSAVEESKRKKWQKNLAQVLAVESPHDHCLTQSCEVCFREDVALSSLDRQDTTLLLCESCLAQYDLGSMLTSAAKAGTAVLCRYERQPEGKSFRIDRAFYQIHGRSDAKCDDAVITYHINDLAAQNYRQPRAIYLPVGLYQHPDMDELANVASGFGISRLAALKMDVDNLGKVLSVSIPQSDRTFSRVASISRNLNYFFKYHLNTILMSGCVGRTQDAAMRDRKGKGRQLAVVYSGGDDLFIIGNWLDVTEAAFDINQAFSEFAGNPFITLSGGIAVNHEKYPVYQYARDAGEAEEQAKSATQEEDPRPKNALTLFNNKTFKWPLAEKVAARVQLFSKFLSLSSDRLSVRVGGASAGFFYRLLALARMFNEKRALVLPKAAYLLARAKVTDDRRQAVELENIVMTSSAQEWRITEAAAMWTLMLMRKGE